MNSQTTIDELEKGARRYTAATQKAEFRASQTVLW